jgi:hypothetical protein
LTRLSSFLHLALLATQLTGRDVQAVQLKEDTCTDSGEGRKVACVLVEARVGGAVSSAQAAPEKDPSSVAAASFTAVRAEVEAFFRQATAKDWSAVLGHVWPAKIAAGREPPTADATWRSLDQLESGGAARAAVSGCGEGHAVGLAAVAVVDNWARVLVARCTKASDASAALPAARLEELWLFRLDGRWRIVRMVGPIT